MAKKQQEELRASKQKETSARRKSKAVAPKQATRVGWLCTVFELNPEVDFLNLDYLPNSADLGDVDFGPYRTRRGASSCRTPRHTSASKLRR